MVNIVTKQEWFEMDDIKSRFYENSVWVPLRASQILYQVGKNGVTGFQEEFYGVGSIAVPLCYKTFAEQLDWMDVGISYTHSGYVEDDKYIPVNIFHDYKNNYDAEHLVLEQHGNSQEKSQWHLSQDLAITLGLKREKNVWLRPDEGYIEVVKLYLNDNEEAELIEIRASHLKDYLAARNMALYITSYRQRQFINENRTHITWTEPFVYKESNTDRWEGRITTISEGGIPYGETTTVFHVSRTDVDNEDDVPVFNNTDENSYDTKILNKKNVGKKLFRIQGELWRTEWVDPAEYSLIIKGEEAPPTFFFITDASGKLESKKTLKNSIKWLWFQPEVISSLLQYRGSSLLWYTKDTGSVKCSPDYPLHFGMNRLGLINVFAKDIALLPEWQQRIWSGYNISPDGKVSKELLDAQMRAQPADSKAPEKYFQFGLLKLNEISGNNLGFVLLREHHAIPEIIKKIHRFRAVDKNGLFDLAKDIARVTADSINVKEIQTLVSPPKNEKWGSLKSLEKLLGLKINPELAHEILGSLVGAYELRHGAAHLPAKDIDEALNLVNIDCGAPYVIQGFQMLDACTSSIFSVIEVLKKWDKEQQ